MIEISRELPGIFLSDSFSFVVDRSLLIYVLILILGL